MRKNIGNLVVINYGKGLPERNRIPGKVPVYSSGGITGVHSEKLADGPGIIIGRKGSVGTVYYSGSEFFPIDTSYYITQLDTQLDLKYLYYLLKSLNLERLNSDSAVPGLSRERVYSIEINVPDSKEEQCRIAGILTSVDDKIELLREQNQVLEELAQTIFKRWFVDFEFPNADGRPYRSSGGRMVESELGEIPEGWKVSGFSDLCDISTGIGSVSTLNRQDGRYPLYGATGLVGQTENYLFEGPVVLTGRVGSLGVVRLIQNKGWVTDNVLVLNPKTGLIGYAYFIAKHIDYSSLNRGSTQPLVTQSDIKNYRTILPESEVLLRFESYFSKHMAKIDLNSHTADTLLYLRIKLLSSLIDS